MEISSSITAIPQFNIHFSSSSSNCQSGSPRNENFPLVVSPFCMPSSSIHEDTDARREPSNSPAACFNWNKLLGVREPWSNKLAISWFKRNFALTPVSLTPIPRSTLQTKLNRSSWIAILGLSRHSRQKILLFHYIELFRIIYSSNSIRNEHSIHVELYIFLLSFCVEAEIKTRRATI